MIGGVFCPLLWNNPNNCAWKNLVGLNTARLNEAPKAVTKCLRVREGIRIVYGPLIFVFDGGLPLRPRSRMKYVFYDIFLIQE